MNGSDTILQVEDRPEDVTILQYAFKQAGIQNPVQVVTDGQQAIDYLSGIGQYADRKIGVDAFLVKHSDARVTIDMCKAIKQFWLLHNQPPVSSRELFP